ncbi:PAS domain-containing protein [Halobacteria archaeon AArc-curdl1]|uniref:histidine kinase n=1 Tax=Natronosalvus hydrolyticus TaxID=2979988 RepID=A0AAP2ZA79_9EURY|nr:PAS domain-containing protein [Halobacteria archaeon AArc-curdl1]
MTNPSSLKPLVYVSGDEEHVARISDDLGVRGGFDVFSARTVADALEQVKTYPRPVCLLSDTRFPDGDWRDLLEAVRASYPTLPFILYPGPEEAPSLEGAFDKGVTGYLHQGSGPTHRTDLCAAIQAAIQSDQTTESLTERKKELQTIQSITKEIDSGDGPLQASLDSIVRTIPDAFQWPDRTHVRLVADGKVAETDGFVLGEDCAGARTTTAGGVDLALTVSVESRDCDENSVVLPEEREFLETVVTMLAGEIERRTYIEQLEETENRFNQITENISEVVWITDASQEEMIYVSPAYESMWGKSLESLYADPTSFLERIHPDDRDRVERAVLEKRHGVYDEEYRIVLPNGELRWIHDRGVPVMNEEGTVYREVGLTEDITDRKEREQQLAVLNRVLRHNLRNEMNVILGNAAEILEHGDAASAEHGDVIRQVATKLLELTDKQRSLAKLLTDSREPEVQNVSTLLEETRAAFETSNATAEIDVTVTAAGTETIRTTPHLEIAIRELVENAIEHGGNGVPAVTIDGTVTDSGAEIRVSDNGPGIPLEEQAVLESGESQLSHGSGLGLWLIHWVVTQAGGSVSFQPTEDAGTTVTLWLPHVPEAA